MKRRNRTATIIVFACSGLLMALFFAGFLSPVRSLLDQVLSPTQRFARRITSSIANGFSLVGSVSTLDHKNQDLQKQVDDLKRQLADVREVQRENELLRAQLDVVEARQYELVSARVLGSSNDTVRSVFQIDKGSSAGIQEGMAVIAGAGLVGVIDDVNSFTSTVLSINDPVFKISAISQTSRATGIVRGQLGTGLKMEKISQNEAINTGETVITTGSGLVPKGLIIGTIESIQRADNAIFQGANIKPNLNVGKLELVFVIKGSK